MKEDTQEFRRKILKTRSLELIRKHTRNVEKGQDAIVDA